MSVLDNEIRGREPHSGGQQAGLFLYRPPPAFLFLQTKYTDNNITVPLTYCYGIFMPESDQHLFRNPLIVFIYVFILAVATI